MSTVALPLRAPQSGDVISLQLQIAVNGHVSISCVTLSPDMVRRISSINQSANQAIKQAIAESIEAPTPVELVDRVLPHTRIKVIGHSTSENKFGQPHIVYHVEYSVVNPAMNLSINLSNSRSNSPTSLPISLPASRRNSDFEIKPEQSADQLSIQTNDQANDQAINQINNHPFSPLKFPPIVSARRYNDFLALHEALEQVFVCLPPFPSRSFSLGLAKTDPKVRELELTVYIQLLAAREDIKQSRILEKFLDIDPIDQSTNQPIDLFGSEREREVALRMAEIDQIVQNKLETMKQSAEHSRCQRFELLTDCSIIQSIKHIDVDGLKPSDEEELRPTSYSSRAEPVTRDRSHSDAESKVDPSMNQRAPHTPLLTLVASSTIASLHRCFLISPTVLLVIGGDESALAKVDMFFTNVFSSISSSFSSIFSSPSKPSNNQQTSSSFGSFFSSPSKQQPPAVVNDQDTLSIKQHQRPAVQQSDDAKYPFGSLYVFTRPSVDDEWRASLSLFFERALTCMSYDTVKKWLYLTQDDGVVHVYAPGADDWHVVNKVWTIAQHQSRIIECLFSRTNSALFTLSEDGSCARFDVLSIRVSCTIQHTLGEVTCMAVDSECERVMLGSVDRSIYVYDTTRSAVAARRMHDRQTGMASLATQPSSRRLGVLQGHDASVQCVAYHTKTNRLASGSADGALILWRLAAPGREEHSKQLHRLKGHTASLKRVCFDETGEYLASGDEDGHVCVWSTSTGMAVVAWKPHTSQILSLQLKHGCCITTGEDNQAKIWILDSR